MLPRIRDVKVKTCEVRDNAAGSGSDDGGQQGAVSVRRWRLRAERESPVGQRRILSAR